MNTQELQAQLKTFETYHKLWTDPHFQSWKVGMQATVDAIDTALMNSNWGNKDLKAHLALMGMSPPKSHDEELRLYIAMKAVLGFWTRKLSLLKTQSDRYEETKRKLLELGRNGDIGTNRSVPAR